MSFIDEIKTITNEKNIYLNEPMNKHTTFRTGGNADFFVIPESKEEIIKLLQLDIPKTVIGNGSNVLVKDGGIRGLVLKIATNNYLIQDKTIIADAGCMLAKLSYVAYENSLTGLEFACGIPGTLGGAIYMNAGAYGKEMSNIVIATEMVDYSGNISVITNHEFDYRKSVFQRNNGIILSSKLRLESGNQEEIKAQMETNNKSRREKQPIDKPSAGSTFKRPKDNFAGKLIEDAGLKGYKIGGAAVSDVHAGFIINANNATSKDILNLIKYVQERVYEKFEVMLEPEIKILGED